MGASGGGLWLGDSPPVTRPASWLGGGGRVIPCADVPGEAKQARLYGRRSFFRRGAPPPPIEPGPLPGGWDDGAGDDPGEGAAVYDRRGSGSVQRINRSHTSRAPRAHTSPPAVEIGTPIQKPQPAQLASHHDMSNPNSVTAQISASEPTYSHRTNSGEKLRSNRTSRSKASLGARPALLGGSLGANGAEVSEFMRSRIRKPGLRSAKATPHPCGRCTSCFPIMHLSCRRTSTPV
jgi:hypothetical protein